mmetsp:Transcript_44279/g.94366  ORF Transcript_44279/g.94366 Transcript_44279/m.94366 type:complete len:223 (+) Transcript_44279:860-1528(+)
MECEDGRRCRNGTIHSTGVLHPKPRSQHAAIGAPEGHNSALLAKSLPQGADEIRIVGQGLLHRQVVQVTCPLCPRIRRPAMEGHALTIVAMFRKHEGRTEVFSALPHQARGVHIEFDVGLVPAIKENRSPLPPVAVVHKVPLPKRALASGRRRPREVVDILLMPMERHIMNARATFRGQVNGTQSRDEADAGPRQKFCGALSCQNKEEQERNRHGTSQHRWP